MNNFEIKVDESDINRRIDVFLAMNLESLCKQKSCKVKLQA